MRKNRDALANRIQVYRRQRRKRTILWILLGMVVLPTLLLRFVVGVAYFQGESLLPEIPQNSCILYLKTGSYGGGDIVIFEDSGAARPLITRAAEYEKSWKNEPAKQTRILGKVIWHFGGKG